MITPRETIVAALLTKLQGLMVPADPSVENSTPTPFRTIDREWTGLDQSNYQDKLPALFLIELPEKHVTSGRGMPSRIDLSFDLVLAIPRSSTAVGCSDLNPLLDALDALFLPTPREKMQGSTNCTLGGIVYDVWIEGTIQKNPSYLGGSASLAVAPLHIRNTNSQ